MYATPEDLVTRFGEREMAQIAGDAAPTNAKLLAACLDAGQLADSYLSRAVVLPLATVPAVLVGVCADIARYRLHDDQTKEGGETGKTTMRMRYEDAIKWLEGVAAGTILLFPKERQADPKAPHPLTGNHRIAVVAPPVVFDQATLDKMDAVR